ncbi:MAG: hypothetical protein AVDCRST_MAG73-4256 [uncultured Thermomicrobiales bacterium]|uniref:GlsB/YeaQ/YmgE family stress response membrane protein n=1 Tax=uncultured Thermomicrobiales bacterium TaxID=1645740 RepID=A0A6J4V7P9_9BACT|nr:MAG: hypothetical protein AVDCRST_MAG73-4256 [uncultured Thermomicrobiales bacterium]
MGDFGFIGWAVLGILAGWLAGVVTRTDRGILGDLLLGLAGAFVAGLIVDGTASFIASLFAATVAAVVLVFAKNLILGRRNA